MSIEPYVTSDVTCTGWSKLGDVWVSREPLRDASTGLYARLTWAGAVAACSKVGGRLIRADEVVELHAAAARGEAVEPAPVTLPDAALCADAGVPFDWERHGPEVEAFLTVNMGGLAWAQYHDAEVARRLTALGATPDSLLANVGKLWVSGVVAGGRFYTPPPGRAWLTGWWDGHRFIQPVPAPGSQGPHGAEDEHDYGTLTVAVSDAEP